ncbi:MAG: nitroreductase [Clostridia bacterium]|nr:nitroreductase [Clostridia bacterium]
MIMEALEAILTRRSTRRYTGEMPDKTLIEQVIDAGRHAPSGGNNQTTHLMVFSDPDKLQVLSGLVQTAFAAMEITEGMYGSLKNSIQASKKGGYVFYYGAPVLIVTANKKGYGNAMADSACVLENMMIAASALDLGTCWINQLHWLDEEESVRAYLEKAGLGEDETITGGLILGIPEGGKPAREPALRKGNPVTWT